MKQLLFGVFLVLGVSIEAQNVNFPDANFKNALLNYDPVIDVNNDGEISYAEAENFTAGIWRVLDVSSKNISDLTGFQAFVNISTLKCSYNQLTSLDVSSNKDLEFLYCENNQLTSLDVSNNILKYLYCNNNRLTSIDLGQNTALEIVNCNNNQLTSLDVSKNTFLVDLKCGSNNLTNIDISKNINLRKLDCYDNKLTSLDVRNNIALGSLSCHNNQLISLDISNRINSNFRYLNFINNPDLSCVTVDNQTESRNWPKQQDVWYTDGETNITYYTFDWDDHIVFSEDCSALSNQDITDNTFIVYPNPATNFITIDSTLEGNYRLVSILGKAVGKGGLKVGENTIDLSKLNKGVYFLNIHSNNNSKTLKIVKD